MIRQCCAGAGLTAPYALDIEQEVVSTDASVYALNVTGGLPGSGVDGSLVYRVSASNLHQVLGSRCAVANTHAPSQQTLRSAQLPSCTQAHC